MNDALPIPDIESTVQRLADEFKGTFAIETIRRYALDSLSGFSSSAESPTLGQYVPLFVYRFTRERLRAAAQVEGKLKKEMPEVLFVCVHNAGRSQIAAALMHSLSGGRVHVRSAGSTPASEINPAVVEAMTEIGLDLSQEFPKPLRDEFVEAADVVITMGCGDACPIYPGKRYLDWEVDDPAGQPIEAVRRIREDIRERVVGLLGELSISG